MSSSLPIPFTGKSLRIAILAHSTNPRGGVVHAMELGNALHDLGHQVTLHAPDPKGQGLFRTPRCAFTAVPATPCSQHLPELVEQRIRDYVAWFERPETPRFDIYHAQDSISANALALLTERNIIAGFVRTVHHLDQFEEPQLTAWQRHGFMAADEVYCVSQLWQDVLQQDYGVAAKLVSNGVDTVRFTSISSDRDTILRSRLGLKNGPVFLAVGGIEPRKNTLAILNAFNLFQRCHPTAQLIIAGGVSLLDHSGYQQQFNDAVIASGLTFGTGRGLILAGKVDDADMPALFRCADTLVFPSLKEGFGLVVLEALACGTPVVVSKIAPFTEYLDADTCTWVDPTDPFAIAIGMENACAPENLERVRTAGYAVARRFSWESAALTHLNYYNLHSNAISEKHHA